jgi:hypothetical protein
MSPSVLVDVATGIASLYVITALFWKAVQAWIAQLLQFRANHFEASPKVLLRGSQTAATDTANAALDQRSWEC